MLERPLEYFDRAGTIAVGGAAQQVAATNVNRKALFFYNESDTNMRVSFGDTNASATLGFLVKPDYYWEPPAVPRGKVTVYCATTGKAFSCGEFA